MARPLMSSFWLGGAAMALSLAWLLPNHAPPWITFHADAWTAMTLTAVAVAVMLRTRQDRTEWHGLALLSAILILVVVLQYSFGLIWQFGVAWINMAFLLGFLLAQLAGSSWERATHLQVADLLFAALVVSATVSVGLQFHQWLNLGPIGPWILSSRGGRPFANMAQPNQLGSLLLLGVLGCAWLNLRGWLNVYLAVPLAMWFFIGLALTESRTGWINVLLISSSIFAWRKLPGARRLPVIAFALSSFYAMCVLWLPTLNELFGVTSVPMQLRPIGDNLRISIWKMLIEATEWHAWAGYGWGQVVHAQFLMNPEQMLPQVSLQQAHNLVLDLALWNGIPIGLAVSALLGRWAWLAIRRVTNIFQMLMLLFLAVLFVHAMLEYPLQYAYFLLPAGLMMGALNFSLGFRVVFRTPPWFAGLITLVAAAILSITIRDYFRVETSMYGLRFEQRKIQTSIPATPPDVLVLTQWHDYIYLARLDPDGNHSAEDLAWANNLVRTLPSALGMYKLASMLAFAGRADEAQHWLKVSCQINPQQQCEIIRMKWLEDSAKHAAIAAIPWPVPAS